MECKTADELLALAKAEGVELTREQAEEYIKLMGARELTDEELAKVAGGIIITGSDLQREMELSKAIHDAVTNGCSIKFFYLLYIKIYYNI